MMNNTNSTVAIAIQPNSWWKKDHNGRETFIPTILAKYILQNVQFIFDRQELYYYKNGVYRPGGENLIRSIVVKLLDERFRKFHTAEVLEVIYSTLINNSAKLDTSLQYINLENGLLDWQTGQFFTHSPSLMSSVRIPVKFDPSATCPLIESFLRQVLPIDCFDLALELFGYCLLPTPKLEKAFMFVGAGANGKSKFLALLNRFLGYDNVSAESLHAITENRFRAANLSGKLANIYPDIDARRLETSSEFKALVSGDRISAERKNRDPFTLQNFARLIFSANEIPRSNDNTDGYHRRWIIFRFPNQFSSGKADPNILNKLTTETELSGLLNLVLPALQQLMQKNQFSIPNIVQKELDSYRQNNDTIALFTEEHCVLNMHISVPKQELFNAYKNWACDNNYKPFSAGRFNEHLTTLYPTIKEDRNSGIRRWRGIGMAANY